MAVVGTLTPTRNHLMVSNFNKIMSQSEMEPLGAESVAIRDCNGNMVGAKRHSEMDQQHLNFSSHHPQPQ